MKAAFFKEHGGAEKVLYDDYRDPVPGPDDAVVRVGACGLNHVDILLLDGRFPPPEGLPHVNGCEVTGTIETVGAAVRGLARGQRAIIFPGFACGRCEYCVRGERTVCVKYGYLGAHRDGGYAELVKAPAANILPLPDAISFEAGAALPMAMLTAWHALVAKAELKPGQTRKESEGVFLVRDGRAEFLPIKMGVAGDKYFEVLSGLTIGDEVITGPYNSVRAMADGDPVKVDNTKKGRLGG